MAHVIQKQDAAGATLFLELHPDRRQFRWVSDNRVAYQFPEKCDANFYIGQTGLTDVSVARA